jgi:hypothetical protein
VAEHPDAQRFREGLEGASAELFADDVVWHGAAANGGETRGKDAAAGVLAGAGGDAPALAVKDLYADGAHTVAWLERSAGGRSLDQAVVFHIDDSGKATEVWSMPTDGEIAAALESGGPAPVHRNLPVFATAEETRGRNTFEPEDIANIEAFLREDVHWRTSSDWGEGPSNRDQCIEQFKGFLAGTGGTLHMEIFATFADDAHALSFVELTAQHPQHPDRRMDFKEVNLFHLDDNGKCFEFWGIQDDPDEANAFWAP